MINSLEKDLANMRYGLLFALITLLYGFGLGATFGIYEDGIKGYLQEQADAVLVPVYDGDRAKVEKITSKSWVYFKRAHIHANGLGTTSLALILVLCYLPVRARLKSATALMLGIGSLGYSMFWMFAGMRAPGLGSTGLAKESLKWLAMPTAGLCMLGLIAVTAFVISTLFLAGNRDPGEKER